MMAPTSVLEVSMASTTPLVSVVTPVYNGFRFLPECMESVLGQRYRNLEYVIVNNCSTDGTRELAEEYAKRDGRIRIINNSSFLELIDNHNLALRSVNPHSKYCKVLSVDDSIFPDCIEKMVEVAEKHATAGVIASYSINDTGVQRIKLPLDVEFMTGKEAGRAQLLGQALFKAPSALLYRTAMVQRHEPFFPGPSPNADMAAFFRDMTHSDYGCVHQILCHARVHPGSVSSTLCRYNSLLVDRLEFLSRFGRWYLDEQELNVCLAQLLDEYYGYLAERALHLVERRFWEYHADRLMSLGMEFDRSRLACAMLSKIADLVGNPKQSAEKLLRSLRSCRWRRS